MKSPTNTFDRPQFGYFVISGADMSTLDRKLYKKNKNIFLLILCLVLQSKSNKAKYSVNKSGTSHVRVSVVYLINILFLVE